MRDIQKKYSDRTDLNQLTHWHLRVMAHQAQHVSYKEDCGIIINFVYQ